MKIKGGTTNVVVIIILAFWSAGFFYAPSICFADISGIRINEICWMGDFESSSHEWIELFNSGDEYVDLSSWRLAADDGSPNIILAGTVKEGGYFLLERSSDESVSSVLADQIYTGALKNSGEKLILYDQSNSIIDIVDNADGWLGGDNNSKLTMALNSHGIWQSSPLTGGTPGKVNVFATTTVLNGEDNNDTTNYSNIREEADSVTTEETANSEDSTLVNKQNKADNINKVQFGDVLINEICSDPGDGEVEWVELFLLKNINLDLEGWYLSDGSGAHSKLSGQLVAKKNRFLVIEKPKGNLNNKGDKVSLFNADRELIDVVAYGDWDDGYMANNAPLANDPLTIARKYDGYNTGNNKEDFSLTISPSKGESNVIILSDKEDQDKNKKNFDYSAEVIINEIMPNPKGADTNNEWIELYNNGDVDVDLSAWSLLDASGRRYIFKDSFTKSAIKKKSYLIIEREISHIVLNNDQDEIFLFLPGSSTAIDEVFYEKSLEGLSYARIMKDSRSSWSWTKKPTPGAENIIKEENYPPEPDFYCPKDALAGSPIIFDATDTEDINNDQLSFYWNFGDGFNSTLPVAEHTYLHSGSYEILLRASDGQKEGKIKKTINISTDNTDKEDLSIDWAAENNIVLNEKRDIGNIIINEFLPNPKGDDSQGEWVELYNRGETRVDLLDWSLDDQEGGSHAYRFLSSVYFEPGQYLLITRKQSGLALNNTEDAVRLFDFKGNIVDEIKYRKPKEDLSWARNKNGKFVWTSSLTPGQKNIIDLFESDKKLKRTRAEEDRIKNTDESVTKYYNIDLVDINNYEKGDKVIATGTVTVLPGVFSTHYFYMENGRGIQLYNFHEKFPDLKIYDLVAVQGELSQVNGEWRIKTTFANDIKIVGHGVLQAKNISCAEVSDDVCGSMVRVEAEVVEKKGSSIFLDDGSGESLVFFKKEADIDIKKIRVGDKIAVTAIVNRTRSGLRLLPRDNSDIVLAKAKTKSTGQIKGISSAEDEWTLTARSPRKQLIPYLLVLFITVIITLSGIAIKYHWFV